MRRASRFLKTLADETRLKMLWLLRRQGELCVCDLMGTLGATQSKVSRHLATLRHAGLVSDRHEGIWSYYGLRLPRDALQRSVLDALLTSLDATPEATRLVRALDRWLRVKDRAGGCGLSCGGSGGRGRHGRRPSSGRRGGARRALGPRRLGVADPALRARTRRRPWQTAPAAVR